ncbi:MAG: T9SS type A sorting domain-containing protein [Candidatus Kapabacteria bacterium]|nr:T9SS type A sorting domain-containing protein [Candidatus Kapabacteria bacterium]
MRHLTRHLLVVLTIVLTCSGASAQLDTARVDLLLWGKLVSATATSIVVDATRADGITGQFSVDVTPATSIAGCTIDSVQPGTYTLVQLDPNSAADRAEFIKFDGCSATISFVGRVERAITSGLRITTSQDSDLGVAGVSVDVLVSVGTTVVSCDGYPLRLDEIAPLAEVGISGYGTSSNFSASSVQTFNDCSQTLGGEATFIAFRDSLFIVALAGSSDTLALASMPDYSKVPLDSGLIIYSCDGRMLSVDELVMGDPLVISYIDNPRRGKFLQYAQLQKNCPRHATGRITELSGNEMTIVDLGGTTIKGLLTAETAVTSCAKTDATRDDLEVGMTIGASLYGSEDARTFGSITIIEDCPFAFYTQGTVISRTDSTLTVNGYGADGAEKSTEFTSSQATLVTNCLNEPQPSNSVEPGNTVGVYYSVRRGQLVSDLIAVLDPCTIAYVGGTIQSVTPTTVELFVDGPQSVVTLTYDANSSFANCAGRGIDIDTSLIGKTLFGIYNTSADPAYLMSATINVGCPAYGNVEGTVVLVTDSSIAVQTAKGLEDYLRSPYVSVYDTVMQPLEWSAITAGRMICMTVDEQARLVLRVFVDKACEELPGGPRVSKIVGKVVDATETTVLIETRTGITTYLITDDTRMMTSSQSEVTFIPQGAMVSIMCMDHTPAGMPIAASVVVMDGTTGISDYDDSNTPALLPNPASSIVSLGGDDAFTSATIIDLNGRVVLTSVSRSIDISSLPIGAYTVVVSSPRDVRSAMLQVVR